jgi:hypothetical protein
MKKMAFGVFLVLAASYLCQQAQAQSLTWDIKFLQGAKWESVSIARAIRMENGEKFQIAIKPVSDSYCYVVLQDSAREMFVINDKPIKAGAEINLGPYEIVDPPGAETLYVIMSLAKQDKLESLINAYNANPGNSQNGENLRQEIARLQDVVSALGQPSSEFIPGGGTSRGSTQEYVTRFTEKNIYVSPIIIRH